MVSSGARTVIVAVAVFPVPPFVALTLPVMLIWLPPAMPVTLTENVHEPLAGIVPPMRLTEDAPAAAATIPAPHVPISPLGVAIANPLGMVSVKATPVSPAVALGLLIVNVSVVFAARDRFAAPNNFTITGGASTATFAVLLGAPAPLWSE